MSEIITAARPYAHAAFEYAREHKVVDAWSKSLALLAAVALDNKVQSLLDNPRLSHTERADMLIGICKGELDTGCENLIRLLAENHRLKLLPEIFNEFEIHRAELEGIVEATLISAREVSAPQLQKITKVLETRLGKKVQLQSKVEESLIGGAVIKAGDMVIDGSLKSRLEKMSIAILR